MKHCCKCKTEDQSKKYFVICQTKSSTCYRCEDCEHAKRRATWKKNKHKHLEHNRLNNKAWYEKNRDLKKFKNKQWRLDNPEAVRTYHREYERVKRQDPIYRLNQAVSSALRRAISDKGGRKWQTVLGYSTADLKAHLEKQFKGGISWDNYGDWHIDHIRPISSFDFTKRGDFKMCWALSNLQPLWAKDNISKGAKLQPQLEA